MKEFDPSDYIKSLLKIFQLYEAKLEAKIVRLWSTAKDKPETVTVRVIKERIAELRELMGDLKRESSEWVNENVPDAYNSGQVVALSQLRKAFGDDVFSTNGAVHKQLVDIFSKELNGRFDDVAGTIARSVSDIYRKIQLESTISAAFGTETVKGAAKSISRDLRKRGVTGFIDKAGKRWNMESYADMAARTVLMKAHLQGIETEFIGHGVDLVKISSHPMSCSKCAKYQGLVLSLTGQTPYYITLEQAKADGLFHPRCRHAMSMYYEESEESR